MITPVLNALSDLMNECGKCGIPQQAVLINSPDMFARALVELTYDERRQAGVLELPTAEILTFESGMLQGLRIARMKVIPDAVQ